MKKVLFPILALVLALGLALPMASAGPVAAQDGGTTMTVVSDTDASCWSGATEADIDGDGYIVPPSDAVWRSAVSCWEHPNWNGKLNPPDAKAKLLEPPGVADWIWKAYQVTKPESYTGDIIFFMKLIAIPDNAVNIQAELFVTADNAYYFYVNDGDWSGPPVGTASFISGSNPTNFYYVSDGTNNLGGGTDSVGYETTGSVYPRDAAISTAVEA